MSVQKLISKSTVQQQLCAQSLSCVRLFVIPWTVGCQAPLFMEFSKQEYWSVLPFLLQGIFLAQGSNLRLLHLLRWQVDSLSQASPGKLLTTGTK